MNSKLENCYKHALLAKKALVKSIEEIEKARRFDDSGFDAFHMLLQGQQEIMFAVVNLIEAQGDVTVEPQSLLSKPIVADPIVSSDQSKVTNEYLG